ncbi:NADP-dependent malic enzyme [Coccomyxa sp. Obi]|nr:NADP-dependent malic enzyme [Coccomyxa sp. Obi]
MLYATSSTAVGVANATDASAQPLDSVQVKPRLDNIVFPEPSNTNAPTGIQAIRTPSINRGLATGMEVRRELRMQGLIPPGLSDLQVELDRAHAALSKCCTPLDKYQAIMGLKETNEDCFYALIAQRLSDYLPVIYTPTVGEACQQWSSLLTRPKGLYISILDKGNVANVLSNWPEEEVKIAILTDGERILGLGDLGCNGMGIPVGKAAVHTAGAGIHPRYTLPITLDVGCNTASVREDPFYVGLRQERVRGQKYDDFIDEVLSCLRQRYGASLVIHWEDFGASNAFRLLARYRERGYATFNDDIQATAAVTLGALMGAQRLPGVPRLRDQTFLFFGAGQANLGAAQLLIRALADEGISEEAAKRQIWLFDSQGIVYMGRKGRPLSPQKAAFARGEEDAGLSQGLGTDLCKAVRLVKPSSLIGAAARGGAFSEDVIRALNQVTQQRFGESARPAVFALSNPVEEAECTAQQAYDWTDGAAVYASGTAFAPVRRNDGTTFLPGQCNNCLVFPGIALGCIAAGATEVTDSMMLAAARGISHKLTAEELERESVLPQIVRLSEVARAVGAAVALEAIHSGKSSRMGLNSLRRLAESDGTSHAKALQLAKNCIGQMQYDPFLPGSGLKNL